MEDQEGYGLPDGEHVSNMFDALADTVTGNEGFGLTRAQHYAFGVLSACDSLSYQQRVDGNESFFGAIGKGLKDIWEYVLKMFKSIWGFFFGSSEDSSKKKIEDAKKAVESNKQAMIDGDIKEDKAYNLHNLQVTLKHGFEGYKEFVEKAAATNQLHDPEELQLMKKVKTALDQNISKTGPIIEHASQEIKSFSNAKACQEYLLQLLKCCENDQALAQTFKSELEKKMDGLTAAMAKGDDGKLADRVKGVKHFLMIMSGVGKHLTAIVADVKKVSTTVTSMFQEKKKDA